MQLPSKRYQAIISLILMVMITLYIAVFPSSLIKQLATLPWLDMTLAMFALALSFHYKKGRACFCAFLLLGYQAFPLTLPDFVLTNIYANLLPQVMVLSMAYLISDSERGVSIPVMKERVATFIAIIFLLIIVNMLVTKYIGTMSFTLYLVMALSTPVLAYQLWSSPKYENTVFCYIGSTMALIGLIGAPASNVILSLFAISLLILVFNEGHKMAYFDQLTGIESRRSLDVSSRGLSKQFTVVMCDVDHFKRFNDKYGHDTGDEVLKLVAKKVQQVGGGGNAYRYGGEEFCLLFDGKSADEIYKYVEVIRQDIASYPFAVRSSKRKNGTPSDRTGKGKTNSVQITMSFGIAQTTRGERFERVINQADEQLYMAKDAGRNCIMLPVAGSPKYSR